MIIDYVDEALGVFATDDVSTASPSRVLVGVASFLREQRSDAIGELRTERCLEAATIPL